MADQIKNALIGLFVVAACAIVVYLMLFLHPKVGNESRLLRVRFSNIDKVTVGTRVTYAGKPAGEVKHILEIDDPENPRPVMNGYVYIYELILAVDSNVNVYNSDEVSLRTSGLLGEKSVSIMPQPPKPGQPLKLINDEILYANESGGVEDTLKEFKDLSDKFEQALDGIIDTIHDMKQQKLWTKVGDTATTFQTTAQDIDKTAKNLTSITESVNKPEQLAQTVDNVHALSERALTSWNNVDTTVANLVAASGDIKKMTENGHNLVIDIANGKGTAGKLIVNDDLYLRAVAIMNKAEVIMDDINHYGILFHLDKGWQRVRARRANLLNRLCTPQEFRNYFNDEMNQITTSLSRVSQVMQETQCDCNVEDLCYNQDFTKVFSELLRKVDALEKSLQMYNDQLQDCKAQETELTPCY